MAGTLVRNLVFRSIEDKARGLLPCTGVELGVGFVAGVLLLQVANLLVAIPAGLVLVAALVAWRRFDHDRADYVRVFLRRRFSKGRAYNANEVDERFAPFAPR